MSERDIVERLRAPAYWMSGSSEGHEGDNAAPLEAANEIERLRAALATARNDALEEAAQVLQTVVRGAHPVWLEPVFDSRGNAVEMDEGVILDRLPRVIRALKKGKETIDG